MRVPATALLLSCMVALAACSRAGTGVVIAGSTSVQPYAEVLAEDYHILYPDSVIDIQGGGSTAGIMAVQNGTAVIGMSSRELEGDERELYSVEIAKDGLAFVVHPDNPLDGLTMAQIQSIYAGRITEWSDFGGPAAKIHIIVREEGSGTRSVFESLVMGSEQITPKAIIQASNGAIRQLVSGDPDAIGFISLGLVDNTVKALRLDGVEATLENVSNGGYRLYRSFLLLLRSAPDGQAGQFIDYALSERGQRILLQEGLIPVVGTEAGD